MVEVIDASAIESIGAPKRKAMDVEEIYISKDSGSEKMLEAVTNLLNGYRYLPDEIFAFTDWVTVQSPRKLTRFLSRIFFNRNRGNFS